MQFESMINRAFSVYAAPINQNRKFKDTITKLSGLANL
jgi:hypothetical protein